MDYGYYEEASPGPLGMADPAGVWDRPMLDFPDWLTLGSSWGGGEGR